MTSDSDDAVQGRTATEHEKHTLLLDVSPEVKQPQSSTVQAKRSLSEGDASDRQSSSRGSKQASSSTRNGADNSDSSTFNSSFRPERDTLDNSRPRSTSRLKLTDIPAQLIADTAQMTYEGLHHVMTNVIDQTKDVIRCGRRTFDVWMAVSAIVAEINANEPTSKKS
jgi:hypothetical protein